MRKENYHILVCCEKASQRCILTLYVKGNGKCREVFHCDGMIGAAGLGKQVEGDRKTPRGTFQIRNIAYGTKENPKGSRFFHYVKIEKGMVWRCDPEKPDYNTLAITGELPGDWTTEKDEDLYQYGQSEEGGQYHYFLDIGYNEKRIPGAGSAIFLHCWKGPGYPTAGCIAIAEENMIRLLRTVDPECCWITIQ